MPAPVDGYDLLKRFKYLRVVDVVDAMDGIGYFNIGLMDPDIRPLWLGMKWWGVAVTQRCVPANRPMWPLKTTAEIVDAHGIWFKEVGNLGMAEYVRPGSVVVTDTGGSGEVGFWGSNNALGMVARGAVGIVTDGYCRDTAEITLQKTPICARKRGRTIIPGRIMTVEVQTTVGCGGAQVRPGDIVGCDDDGIVAVHEVFPPGSHDRRIVRSLHQYLPRHPESIATVKKFLAERDLPPAPQNLTPTP